MSETMTNTPEFEEAELLLPWYATGKLSDEEMQIVDAWLSEHPEAADRLESVREEQHLTVVGNEAIKVPGPAALTRFMQDIEAEGDAKVQSAGLFAGLFGMIGEFMAGFSPQVMGVAAAACLGLLVVQATVIGTLVGGGDGAGGFVPAAVEAPAPAGPVALVQFQDSATVTAISDLLKETGAKIVDGPKAGGSYDIVFPKGTDLDTAIADLLQRTDIVKGAFPGSS